ncbi:MAG TPA: rRNA maturation RNase YbeY [Deinococcales bacterium]|nr:rRNA maturation RNase YbeY [Deinococcales bacterium]
MISLVDETDRLGEAELTAFREHLEQYVATIGPDDGLAPLPAGMPRLSVVLTDDLRIAALNARDRGVPGPTDVLSYPANEPDDSGFPVLPFLGDVFISLDTAGDQAETAGHPLLAELLLLAVHGFTHLRGYDHRTEEEWTIFRTEQAKMLGLLDRNGGR